MSYALKVNNALIVDSWAMVVMVSLVLTAGTCFLMWLGDQITAGGIGNGISIILFAGILSRIPTSVSSLYSGVVSWANGGAAADGALHPALVVLLLVGVLALVVFVVFISDAERRIPVQYAKRQVGRKMYGGQSSHLPMKVNMSGVLPIIFAQSIASLPITVWSFIGIPAEEPCPAPFMMRLIPSPSSIWWCTLS